MPPHIILLEETRVGRPARIGTVEGRPVFSSIHRRPVDDIQLYLTPTGLERDNVTDTRAMPGGGQRHGGHDRAVYVYPWREHLPEWLRELNPGVIGFHSFGENMRIVGANERTVRIGDVWAWGDAILVVTGPRLPGATLETYFNHRSMIERMARNGLCGWFMSVARPGMVETRGRIVVMERKLDAPTVAAVFRAKMPLPASS